MFSIQGKGKVIDCTIHGTFGIGIECGMNSKALLINNFIFDNTKGIESNTTSGYWKENIITDNSTDINNNMQPLPAHFINNIVD